MNKEDLFTAFEHFAVASSLSSSSTPSSSSSSSSFLRLVGAWKVVAMADEKYLVASVQSNSCVQIPIIPTYSSVNIFELEEEELQFDHTSYQSTARNESNSSSDNATKGYSSSPHLQQSLLHGDIHIVFHPMYLIPCLYLRLQNINGESITAQDYSQLIGVLDPSFELLEEFHPLLDSPYICPHICSVRDKMSLMDRIKPSKEDAKYDGGRYDTNSQSASKIDSMFITRFLTVVGPMIGLVLEPRKYVLLEKQLSTENL